MSGITVTAAEVKRFWSQFDRADAGEEGCWLWTGPTHNGQAIAWFAGKMRSMRRVAYQLSRREGVPRRRLILTVCLQSHCGRPSHLYVGTYHDRARLMVEHGKGPQRHRKLDCHKEAIAELISAGCPLGRVARIFRTHRQGLYALGYKSTLPPGNPTGKPWRAYP